MPWKAILVATVVLASSIALTILYGANRWQSHTRELEAKLEAARLPIGQEPYDPRELENLPSPVQRYFHAVLGDKQALTAAVAVEHTGTFNMSESGEQWKPFVSNQRVITHRPGFIWDARIRIGISAEKTSHHGQAPDWSQVVQLDSID